MGLTLCIPSTCFKLFNVSLSWCLFFFFECGSFLFPGVLGCREPVWPHAPVALSGQLVLAVHSTFPQFSHPPICSNPLFSWHSAQLQIQLHKNIFVHALSKENKNTELFRQNT